MVSHASTLSNGDCFSRTRFAIFPGSIVPSCELSLDSRALLIVAALKICSRDNPALLQLLHLQIPVQARQISIGRCRRSVRAKEEVGIVAKYTAAFATSGERCAFRSLAAQLSIMDDRHTKR